MNSIYKIYAVKTDDTDFEVLYADKEEAESYFTHVKANPGIKCMILAELEIVADCSVIKEKEIIATYGI